MNLGRVLAASRIACPIRSMLSLTGTATLLRCIPISVPPMSRPASALISQVSDRQFCLPQEPVLNSSAVAVPFMTTAFNFITIDGRQFSDCRLFFYYCLLKFQHITLFSANLRHTISKKSLHFSLTVV